jgi:hypothetical protein
MCFSPDGESGQSDENEVVGVLVGTGDAHTASPAGEFMFNTGFSLK